MKHLLNTLFVNNEEGYAVLDGENIVIKQSDAILGRFPLHILQEIYLFTYAGASPALIGKCAELGINLVFFSPQGKFLARTVGRSRGNVLLRRKQYRLADDKTESCKIARNFIFGKVCNSRQVINRTKRDHGLRIDKDNFVKIASELKAEMAKILLAEDLDNLRGMEGVSASLYFSLFDDMILQNKKDFHFENRSRRPPLDNVNALLSYIYVMLSGECASALEAVGLDSYVGFMHRDRPGRTSLALDLMEELRPCMADRFALTLINDRKITKKDFEKQENGAVYLSVSGRKTVQKEWQERKKVIIEHPFLKEKIQWGMVPYIQALLLARYIRDDLEEYPPFLWK